MRELTLSFPAPGPLLSMNDRGAEALRLGPKVWRDAAFYRWIEAHPGAGPSGRGFPPAAVHTSLPVSGVRRRDPINFAKTVKAIVDGITLAGAWPDDTPEWVEQNIPSLRLDSDLLVIVRVVAR